MQLIHYTGLSALVRCDICLTGVNISYLHTSYQFSTVGFIECPHMKLASCASSEVTELSHFVQKLTHGLHTPNNLHPSLSLSPSSLHTPSLFASGCTQAVSTGPLVFHGEVCQSVRPEKCAKCLYCLWQSAGIPTLTVRECTKWRTKSLSHSLMQNVQGLCRAADVSESGPLTTSLTNHWPNHQEFR